MGNRSSFVRRKREGNAKEKDKSFGNEHLRGDRSVNTSTGRRKCVTLPVQQDPTFASSALCTNEEDSDGAKENAQQASAMVEANVRDQESSTSQVTEHAARAVDRDTVEKDTESADSIGKTSESLSEHERNASQTTVETGLELLIALHSKATRESKIHTLDCVPSNVSALKEHVQCTYDIPRRCQSVIYDSVPLLDSDTLPLHYMRSGDVIDIHFQSEADIKFISGVLDSLTRVVSYLDSIGRELCQANAVQTHISLQQIQDIEDMSSECFHCILNERSHANFFFFFENGGPDLLCRLHKQILSHPWRCLPDELKFLENVSLLICWAMTEMSVVCSTQAVCHSLQSIIVQTAAGNRAKYCPMCVSSSSLRYYSPLEDEQVLKNTTMKASSALTNILETIPSCRMEIARNEAAMTELIRQIIPSSDAFSLDHETSLVILTAFTCMAYSPETHQYLVTQEIIDTVMTASTKQSKENSNFCRYLTCLFLAIVTANPSARQEIPAEQVRSISAFIAEFLESANPTDLHAFEEERGLYWVTMLPHMRVAYTPLLGKPQKDMEVLLLCLKTAILSLRIMNLNSENKHTLAKEGLLDYLQCLPWCLPPQSEVQQCASQLTRDLGSMLTQPPKLVNIARARLATMCFGLDNVLCKHVHELGTELYSTL